MNILFSRLVCLIGFVMLCNATLEAQPITLRKGTVVIVRHAEKGKGNDPALTDTGLLRSYELYNWFMKNRIKPGQVYVSQYKRTRQTADSVVNAFGSRVIQYKADEKAQALRGELLKNLKGSQDILIVGHSNTVPDILRLFGISSYPGEIPDAEHDNLFLIRFKKGKAKFLHIKYGNPALLKQDSM